MHKFQGKFPPPLYLNLSVIGAAEEQSVLPTATPNMPGLLLGDVFPDFEAETTTGTIKLHEFLGDS